MDNLSCGLKIQVIIQITIYLYISYDVVVFFILILHDDHTIYIYRERDEMIRYIWWCQKKKKTGGDGDLSQCDRTRKTSLDRY